MGDADKSRSIGAGRGGAMPWPRGKRKMKSYKNVVKTNRLCYDYAVRVWFFQLITGMGLCKDKVGRRLCSHV